MKLSVSLPDDDVAFLDRYAGEHGVASRSAAVQRAVRLLRASELGPAYEAAWAEWTRDEPVSEADLWEATAGDGPV